VKSSSSPLARHRRLLAVAALSVVALGASACAKTISVSALEAEVANQIAAQQGLARSEVSVDCPEDIEVAEGTVTRCTASVTGQTVEVDVTQMDAEGSVEWLIVQPEPPATPSEPAP